MYSIVIVIIKGELSWESVAGPGTREAVGGGWG